MTKGGPQVLAFVEVIAGRPAASASAASGDWSGMPCSWIAISDIAAALRGLRAARPRGRVAGRAASVGLLGLDELALAGAGAVAGRDPPVAVGALVDRGDAAAGLACVIDADHALRPHADAADGQGGQRRLGGLSSGIRRPSSRSPAPSAGSSRRVQTRIRGAPPRPPIPRLGPEVALGVRAEHPQHEDRRERARRPNWRRLRFSIWPRGHPARSRFSSTLAAPLAEGAGDLALAGLAGVVAQEGEDFVLVRQAVHAWLPSTAVGRRHAKMPHAPAGFGERAMFKHILIPTDGARDRRRRSRPGSSRRR